MRTNLQMNSVPGLPVAEGDSACSDAKFWLLLITIVIVGVAVRLFHLAPGLGNDDHRWILSARHFAGSAGRPDLLLVYSTRTVFLACLALWGVFFDISIGGVTPLMLALASLTIVLVGLTGKVAFGKSVGLVSATFYALHPLTIAYDPYALPDGLANCLLATMLLAFVCYVHKERRVSLLYVGCLAGLMFGTKQYYVLAALPIGFLVLFRPQVAWRARIENSAVLVGSLALGLGVTFLLQAHSTGDPFSEFRVASGYDEVLLATGDQTRYALGVSALLRLLFERLAYLRELFVSGGGLLSFLLLGGCIWGLVNIRKHQVYLVLVAMIGILYLFLTFMPVRTSPLLLVEMQWRYLCVLLPPMVLLAADWTVQILQQLSISLVRKSLVVALVCGLAFGAWIPANWWDRYNVLDLMAIREAVAQSEREHATELMLDEGWRQQLSVENFKNSHVLLQFRDFQDPQGIAAATSWMSQSPGRVLFVLRHGPRDLAMQMRSRSEISRAESTDFPDLISALDAKGMQPTPIEVPDNTLGVWRVYFGGPSKGPIMGWRYVNR